MWLPKHLQSRSDIIPSNVAQLLTRNLQAGEVKLTEKPAATPAITKVKAQPCEHAQHSFFNSGLTVTRLDNVSPYASGFTGASFTSTSLDPMTKSEAAMFDEVGAIWGECKEPLIELFAGRVNV